MTDRRNFLKTLAAGCARPAFAAGKSSFSKSESVYAVMNGDGSI